LIFCHLIFWHQTINPRIFRPKLLWYDGPQVFLYLTKLFRVIRCNIKETETNYYISLTRFSLDLVEQMKNFKPNNFRVLQERDNLLYIPNSIWVEPALVES
jgi:hypothetical protein